MASFKQIINRRDSKVLWDVGANIGAYSVAFLSFARGGAVVAIEPDGRNARALRKTASRSGLPISIMEVAVSDAPGTADFFLDDLAGATGSLVKVGGQTFNERHFGERPKTSTVTVITLDSLLASHPAPDFIKIDVEGNELATLRGARNVLALRPAIMVEVSQDREAVCAILRAHGYALFDARTMNAYDDSTFNVLAY